MHTYEELNAEIVSILRVSDNPVSRYAAARIGYLEAEVKLLELERQWIPLDNANPPADGLYLTYGFWHETIVSHCINGKWNVQGVTHYMPLPEPPAGQP